MPPKIPPNEDEFSLRENCRQQRPCDPALFKSFDTERVKLRENAKGEYDKAQKTLVVELRKLMKAERTQKVADGQK